MTNKKTYKRIPVEYPMGYLAEILFVIVGTPIYLADLQFKCNNNLK